ncbi:hypothetical protein Trydic_g8457 [Trypoxylus dichotomus]
MPWSKTRLISRQNIGAVDEFTQLVIIVTFEYFREDRAQIFHLTYSSQLSNRLKKIRFPRSRECECVDAVIENMGHIIREWTGTDFQHARIQTIHLAGIRLKSTRFVMFVIFTEGE